MEAERAEAIVLRRQPVTESSLIVTWFTRTFGKLKTVAKGARRLKGPFQGKIDLFYLDEIVFLRSRRSDLHLLHDCFLEKPHRKLRESLQHLAAASYVCELTELATEPEDPNEKIFDLLADILDVFEDDCRAAPLIWFELQLLAAAGWTPKWVAQVGSERVLRSLATANLEAARRVRLTAVQVDDMRAVLWRFWDVELGKAPRSRQLLMEHCRK